MIRPIKCSLRRMANFAERVSHAWRLCSRLGFSWAHAWRIAGTWQ